MEYEIIVEEFKTKIIGEDEDDVDLSFRAVVRNNSDDLYVSITLKGLDSEGFEIEDILLTGNIQPGTSKALTEKTYISHEKYDQISEWVLG